MPGRGVFHLLVFLQHQVIAEVFGHPVKAEMKHVLAGIAGQEQPGSARLEAGERENQFVLAAERAGQIDGAEVASHNLADQLEYFLLKLRIHHFDLPERFDVLE